MDDRRQRRSEHPAQAVHFYLRSLAERDDHRAIALADSCGHRIAAAGDDLQTQRLAHRAPLALGCPALDDSDLRVWSVVLRDTAYYVAAVGGRMRRPDALDATLDRLLSAAPPGVASA